MSSALQQAYDGIERLNRASTPQGVCDELTAFTSRFGLTSMVAGAKPLLHPAGDHGLERCLLVSSYPPCWLKRYCSQNYLRIDPVIRRIQSEEGPCLWAEAASGDLEPAARTMFGEAAEFGLKAGFAVPMLTLDGAFAAVSLGGPAAEIPPEARGMISLVSAFAAGRALELRNRGSRRKLTKLTEREVECLKWVADGKSEWETGQILGISEHTVDRHMANARRKLGARTRAQAIATAMRLGLMP
jgi:LuxR family transcriptional regulator, quorum-sensing system regulator BjaR1